MRPYIVPQIPAPGNQKAGPVFRTRVVILNAKEHEPTRKGAERFNRIYFFVFVWPEKITETG